MDEEAARTHTLSIKMLPDDIMLEIFSYLDPPDLICANLTCRHWHSLILQSETLWKTKSLATDDIEAQKYILKSRTEGNSWKESYQMNYELNLIRSKWKRGLFSQPKCVQDLPPKILCPMSAETWGEIFQIELGKQ